MKGKIKETVGQLTNNRHLEDEGIGEKIAGKVQKEIGQVEKVLDKSCGRPRMARVETISYRSGPMKGET